MPLPNVITAPITLDTLRSARAGYGKPMILGEHTAFAEAARTYTTLAGMLTDGFTTADEEYAAALILNSQAKTPPSWTVGRRETPIAQVMIYTVVGVGDGDYIATINGVAHTFGASSNTATEIRDGLLAAVNAGSEPVTASANGSDAMDVSADNAGESFTATATSPGSDMTVAQTTANYGIAEDLAVIRALDATWWAFMEIGRKEYDAKEAAVWAEANRLFFMAQSADAVIPTSPTTDVLSALKALNYEFTALAYYGTDTSYLDAAWLGKCLPEDPGSINWAWQPLTGVVASDLTETEVGYIKGKNGNWFENVGRDVALNGITVGGQYIDIIRGRAWLEYNIALDFADALISADKIPMTPEGLAIADSIIEARLLRAVRQGIVVSGSIVTGTPTWDELEDTDKAARKLVRNWQANIQGAVSEVECQGTLSLP